MDNISVLKKFMSYAQYDPEQKVFNLLSDSYEFRKAIEHMQKLSEYDPTSSFSVLYAKQFFLEQMRKRKLTAFALLSDPHYLDDELEMWNIFQSKEVTALETEILNRFDSLLCKIGTAQQLGNRDYDAERATICESIETVVEELPKCNEDLFLRGGMIAPLANLSTKIHIFDWLADCLLTLEQSQDGLYLCFVRNSDAKSTSNAVSATADGYFGFYIKSNGTLLSINEQVHEKYPGEHKVHRNARYSDDKKYNLFPYRFIFDFADYDYKGIAQSHIIDSDKLDFLNLEPSAYQPLILAMMMLNSKYANTKLDNLPLKYVDSLLPVNIALPTPNQSIMIPDSSTLLDINKTLKISMTSDGVVNSIYANKLGYNSTSPNRNWKEYGNFPTTENIFVKLYGQGFKLNTDKLFESNQHLKRLTSAELSKTNETPNCEFVGTPIQYEVVAYKNAREQLAEYVREQMYQEFIDFGGTAAVNDWFIDHLRANKDSLFDYCIKRYNIYMDGREPNSDDNLPCNINLSISKSGEPVYDISRCFGIKVPFNTGYQPSYSNSHIVRGLNCCVNTTTKASVFFTFRIDTWEDIQRLVGDSVTLPKILIGYNQDGHRVVGNPILDATDKCTGIGTPFEKSEVDKNNRYWTKERWRDYFFHSHIYHDVDSLIPPNTLSSSPCNLIFDFTIGFSKRGIAKLIKEHYNKSGN